MSPLISFCTVGKFYSSPKLPCAGPGGGLGWGRGTHCWDVGKVDRGAGDYSATLAGLFAAGKLNGNPSQTRSGLGAPTPAATVGVGS